MSEETTPQKAPQAPQQAADVAAILASLTDEERAALAKALASRA